MPAESLPPPRNAQKVLFDGNQVEIDNAVAYFRRVGLVFPGADFRLDLF
jgi:hypothetical protein